MSSDSTDYPVIVGPDGIKLRTERMVPDELYHCIYESKVYLFFKDEQGMLNCYEVDQPEAVKEITSNPANLEDILKKYADKQSQQAS